MFYSKVTLRRLMQASALAAMAFACVLPSKNAAAQSNYKVDTTTARGAEGQLSGTLSVTTSKGETVHLRSAAASIFVADPAIADFQAPSSETIFVFGKKSGRTSLFALDDNGYPLAEFEVIVTQPIEDLRTLLRNQMGDYPVNVTYTPRGAILTGLVPNAEVAETAKSITEQFLGNGSVIINKMEVAGSLQVSLHVRVAEVSRSALKTLGVNLAGVGQDGNFVFGLITGAGAGNGAQQGGGTFSTVFQRGVWDINAVLDAMANERLVSVLAEPNLTTVSGEAASFLAGGEFPIPVSQGDNRISVEFRRFGVSLEFVPTVLSNNLINMRVKPEVSELSAQGAVTINGISVPALSTRRADTVVELGSGQSFAIGGLIRRNFSTSISAFPGLGNLPVLGALFRSSNFQKEESELVIIVTPYIVRPAATPTALRAPPDRIAPPSDIGRVLVNQLADKPKRGKSTKPGQARFIME